MSFKYISLTKGYLTKVSTQDYTKLSKFKWRALVTKKVYAARDISVNGKSIIILMHREIKNVKKDQIIDHKDGNSLNNCRRNLRICNYHQNAANSIGNKRRKFQYKGIGLQKGCKNRWYATITCKGKKINLGSYPSQIEAAKAYNVAAIKYFGKFANINTIKE